MSTCTAVPGDGEPQPNVLFIPPCTCPDCAADPPATQPNKTDEDWLRMSGNRQRLRVKNVELGTVGHAVLG